MEEVAKTRPPKHVSRTTFFDAPASYVARHFMCTLCAWAELAGSQPERTNATKLRAEEHCEVESVSL